jgi:hypothetical protein
MKSTLTGSAAVTTTILGNVDAPASNLTPGYAPTAEGTIVTVRERVGAKEA